MDTYVYTFFILNILNVYVLNSIFLILLLRICKNYWNILFRCYFLLCFIERSDVVIFYIFWIIIFLKWTVLKVEKYSQRIHRLFIICFVILTIG